MDLFKRIRGSADKAAASPSIAAPSQTERPLTDTRAVELDARTTTRRELLRMLTRDTLRFAGIPETWIETQVLLEPGSAGRTLMHLRLVLKHWHPEFPQYLVAFQRRLMGEIERYEPDAREWVASITWQLAMEEQCPYLELPDASTWSEQAEGASAAAAAPVVAADIDLDLDGEQDAVEQDLAKLFAVRDAHMEAEDSRSPSAPRP